MEKLEDIVKMILESYPESRNSDWMLFYYVLKLTNPIVLGMSMGSVLKSTYELGVENYGSVIRARRFVMRKHPELRPVKKVRRYRRNRYKEARAYAIKIQSAQSNK